MVRGPEELGGLKEHLDNVFVAVVARSGLGIIREEEDVHPARGTWGAVGRDQVFAARMRGGHVVVESEEERYSPESSCAATCRPKSGWELPRYGNGACIRSGWCDWCIEYRY